MTLISALTPVVTPALADEYEIEQAGASFKITGTQIMALMAANISLDAARITTGTLAVARGGTNIGSYTIGDLLYASAAGVLSQLAGVATGNALISGGVATAPSWGKIGLTTHISGTLAAANGGTGVANGASSTLTLPNAATTISTGGTIALGGFTLTVPATGTAALLGTANNFTATQSVYDSGLALAITLAGAAAGGTVALAATTPAQVASATAGTPLSITASAAIAGSSNAGAAAGGSITLTAGAAARLTSGNADGGSITLQPGAGIGTGIAGKVLIPQSASGVPGLAFTGDTASGIARVSGLMIISGGNNLLRVGTNGVQIGSVSLVFGSGDAVTTIDTGIKRNAAAVVEVNNGTAGQWGSLLAGVRDTQVSAIINTLTLGHQISSGTVAAGHGIGVLLNLATNNAGTPVQDQNAARWTAEWVVATNASQTGRVKHTVFDTAEREYLRGQASGSAPMIGFYGTAAVAQQTVTGSRAAGAALADLLTKLATTGIIVDGTSA